MKIYAYGTGHLRGTLLRAAEVVGCCPELNDPGAADVIFVADDVLDHQKVFPVWADFCQALEQRSSPDVPVVVVSQVPPGWMRVSAAGQPNVFYQVDTIIVRHAVSRMVYPEQFVVGCEDPSMPLPLAYQQYFVAHAFRTVHQMSYESAELAKCAINYYLAQQVQTTNVLAEAAKRADADWDDVCRVLRGDARIGRHAYLRPGALNQHLLRDVETVDRMVDGKFGWVGRS